MTTDEILALHTAQAISEAQNSEAPFQAQVTVPLSELFERGQRTRINATLTPELLSESNKILGERERSAAIELGLQIVLWLKNSKQFTENEIADSLAQLFDYGSLDEKLDKLDTALWTNFHE